MMRSRASVKKHRVCQEYVRMFARNVATLRKQAGIIAESIREHEIEPGEANPLLALHDAVLMADEIAPFVRERFGNFTPWVQ